MLSESNTEFKHILSEIVGEREKMSNPSQPLPLNHIRIINEPNSLSWVYKPVLNSCNNDYEFYVDMCVCVAQPIFNNDNIPLE